MAWSGEHRAFVVEEFLKNSESVVPTQRSFRRHFALRRHDPVPDGKTIRRWVSNFKQTSSALNKKSPGRPRMVNNPGELSRETSKLHQHWRSSLK